MTSEEQYRQAAPYKSTNALAWGGFALVSFIFMVSNRSFPDILLYNLSAGMFLGACIFFGVSWALYERVASYDEIIIIGRNNPCEYLTKQAELFIFGGATLWVIGIILLIIYLSFLLFSIFSVFLICGYIYGAYRYFCGRNFWSGFWLVK